MSRYRNRAARPIRSAAIIGWLVCHAICFGWHVRFSGAAARPDDDSKADSATDADKRASAARLALMRRRAMSLTAEVETEDGPVKVPIVEAPLLRYSNPAAQIVTPDATVWAWGRVGRPAVLASVEESGCEMVALSDRPILLRGRSGVKWSSRDSEIQWKPVPDAAQPDKIPIVRARQMNEIVKRFAATGHYGPGSENLELRLMDRRLLRYFNPEENLIDGAIFAFAAGTNPEVLVLLECREPDGKTQQWYYGCARFSAGELEARLGETIVWTCPAIASWSQTAPYSVARFGEEDIIPESELSPPRKN